MAAAIGPLIAQFTDATHYDRLPNDLRLRAPQCLDAAQALVLALTALAQDERATLNNESVSFYKCVSDMLARRRHTREIWPVEFQYAVAAAARLLPVVVQHTAAQLACQLLRMSGTNSDAYVVLKSALICHETSEGTLFPVENLYASLEANRPVWVCISELVKFGWPSLARELEIIPTLAGAVDLLLPRACELAADDFNCEQIATSYVTLIGWAVNLRFTDPTEVLLPSDDSVRTRLCRLALAWDASIAWEATSALISLTEGVDAGTLRTPDVVGALLAGMRQLGDDDIFAVQQVRDKFDELFDQA